MRNPQDHLKLVSYVVVRLPFYQPENYDDLYQTGVLGLIAACQRFDSSYDDQVWFAYASKYVRGAIYRDRRYQVGRIEKHIQNVKPHAMASSMDVDGFQELAAIQPDNDRLDDWDAIRTVWESQWEATAMERQCLKLVYFDGLSKADAAKTLHVGKATVYRNVKRGLDGLRDAYLAST